MSPRLPPAEADPTLAKDATNARLMVVEDERIVARDLAATLAEFGYEVVAIASSGEDAITTARALRPDLILMDIRLAGKMDGVEASAIIRKEHDTPVIYLTAHSDSETLRRATTTAPLAYLVKPFNPAELRCSIEISLYRHEIEAKLREREQWLATTLRSIGDGVVATGTDARIKFLNPVAEALTGWKHEEAIGKALAQVVTIIEQTSLEAVERPARGRSREAAKPTAQRAGSLVDRGGDSIAVDHSAAPILDDNQVVLGEVTVFRDVTAQREAAEEIRRLNVALEERVVERTDQLEAANKELEAFSYSVAHDLRAPLRGIDGFSQILIEDHLANLGPEGLGHLNRIRASAHRMGQLIDDLLRLARVARTALTTRSVDLSKLANAVAAELRAADPGRLVDLRIQENVRVDGDEPLLRIVVENLLRNAWKYTSKTPHPTIEFGAQKRDGASVCFVRDNGAGFDMSHAARLFGAFQRLHAVTEFEGTGIGLAIVQRILSRHGGRIWAEAEIGRGAAFYFTVGRVDG